ncbi:hypothetical protein HanIR_Chr03g0143161 [Helianthus annuus]|nr:hypothetical protein HanIR_Chr03g0143161 [Helianthus annuus]
MCILSDFCVCTLCGETKNKSQIPVGYSKYYFKSLIGFSRSTFTSSWLVSMLSVYVQIMYGETKYKSQVRSFLHSQSTILNP